MFTKAENKTRAAAWKHINAAIKRGSHWGKEMTKPEYSHGWTEGEYQYITTPIYIIRTPKADALPIPAIEDTREVVPPRHRNVVQLYFKRHDKPHKDQTRALTDAELDLIKRAYKAEKRQLVRVAGIIFTPCYLYDVIRMIRKKGTPVYIDTTYPNEPTFYGRTSVAVLAPVSLKEEGEYDKYLTDNGLTD